MTPESGEPLKAAPLGSRMQVAWVLRDTAAANSDALVAAQWFGGAAAAMVGLSAVAQCFVWAALLLQADGLM